MTIQWLGHSCFLMTTDKGVRILCDPCDAATGYEIAPQECDILTISHDHHDHNYVALALGNPVRIDKSGEYRVGGVRISGISTYHDHDGGKKRGTLWYSVGRYVYVPLAVILCCVALFMNVAF